MATASKNTVGKILKSCNRHEFFFAESKGMWSQFGPLPVCHSPAQTSKGLQKVENTELESKQRSAK